MNSKRLFLSTLFSLLLLSACGRPAITLRVLDAQTQQPIEGAVAIAWWTTTHGLPGLYYHKTARVEEKVSGPDGTFTLSPVPYELSRQIPNIRIYKPGYVGWDNFEIYKGYYSRDFTSARMEKRLGFIYKSQDIYLEPWKKEYSHISHKQFLKRHFPNDHEDIDAFKSLFSKTVRRYEQPLVDKERELLNKDKK